MGATAFQGGQLEGREAKEEPVRIGGAWEGPEPFPLGSPFVAQDSEDQRGAILPEAQSSDGRAGTGAQAFRAHPLLILF